VDLAGRPLSERRKPNMNSKVRTKATLQQRVSSLIAGTQVHFPTGQLTVGGVTYEPATLVQLLKSLGDAIAVADGAKAKWHDALKSLRDENAKVGPVVRAYQSYLVSSLGNAPSTLADFGLAPLKARAPLSVEKKTAAAVKRKATREARHTMGTQQRKTVKGNVVDVVVTPIAAAKPGVPAPPSGAPAQGTSPSGSTPHTP
jgi:hypothetical protein